MRPKAYSACRLSAYPRLVRVDLSRNRAGRPCRRRARHADQTAPAAQTRRKVHGIEKTLLERPPPTSERRRTAEPPRGDGLRKAEAFAASSVPLPPAQREPEDQSGE